MSQAETPPRIAPGTLREIGVVNAIVVRILGLAAGTSSPNVFATLARHRRLFRQWLVFAGGLMPGGRLQRADTELVILRVAHLSGCDYEWDHHVRLGRVAGLGESAIAGARSGANPACHSARQVAMLRAADQLHRDRCIDDLTWCALREHLDERESIELCMLVGHYDMLAMTINSLGVRIDPRE